MPNRDKAALARHYREYQGTPEQIKKRAQRNKARRMMEKEKGVKAVAGKDVDHKRPMRSGGTTTRSNLRVMSVAKNRGWEKPR